MSSETEELFESCRIKSEEISKTLKDIRSIIDRWKKGKENGLTSMGTDSNGGDFFRSILDDCDKLCVNVEEE